jgi:hypothetical protein
MIQQRKPVGSRDASIRRGASGIGVSGTDVSATELPAGNRGSKSMHNIRMMHDESLYTA